MCNDVLITRICTYIYDEHNLTHTQNQQIIFQISKINKIKNKVKKNTSILENEL